jgi:hypothetical protein
MKDKSTKPKLITVWHTAIGVKFSPGNPSLVAVADYDAAKLSPRLAKVFSKIEKSGRDGVKVKTLDKDDRWSARFLLKIHALRDVPEPKDEKVEKKSGKKAPKALTIAKVAKNRVAMKSKKRNALAKAA